MKLEITPWDLTALIRVETISDSKAGQIVIQVPILPSGDPDPMRMPVFIGTVHLNTPRGPMPIMFEIEKCATLSEAINSWAAAVQAAVDRAESQMIQQSIAAGGRNGQAPANGPRLDLTKLKN